MVKALLAGDPGRGFTGPALSVAQYAVTLIAARGTPWDRSRARRRWLVWAAAGVLFQVLLVVVLRAMS